MFRKISHIIITLLVLITTMGFSISKHYCSNNLVSVTVNHEAKSCCGMDSDCCHNETTSYQLEDDFVSTSFIDNNTIDQIDSLFPLFFIIVENISNKEFETIYLIPESPPPLKIQAVLSNLQTYLC